jgi:hypothetical protein
MVDPTRQFLSQCRAERFSKQRSPDANPGLLIFDAATFPDFSALHHGLQVCLAASDSLRPAN